MITGLGLRTKHYNAVLNDKPPVPWFEVITENFLGAGGRPYSVLSRVREIYPVAFHGVGLSIGSIDPLREEYLQQLKKLVSEFQPFIVSDHLSWSRHKGVNSHDLLPLLYTKNNLSHLASRIHFVQEIIGQQLVLENPSLYVSSNKNEMSEPEFIKELCTRTGCGLLLDLNNLVVNKYNLGVDSDQYLDAIAGLDVRQFHIAGHTVHKHIRIDTHDHAPCIETLDLYRRAQQMWPNALPLLEWDDALPELNDLVSMAHEIGAIGVGDSERNPQAKSFVMKRIDVPSKSNHGDPDHQSCQRPTTDAATDESILASSNIARKYHDRFFKYIFSPLGVENYVDEIQDEFLLKRERTEKGGDNAVAAIANPIHGINVLKST